MARKGREIDSLEDLQRLVPTIVKAINADTELGVRASANPLLAMEELGYRITDELRPLVERRIRFPIAIFEELNVLAEEVFKIAGVRFAIDSPAELEIVLFEKLDLPRLQPTEGKRGKGKQRPPTSTNEPAIDLLTGQRVRPPFEDPLEKLRDAHPIMPPLLAYRRLEASQPRLASADLYAKIQRGEVKLPVTRVRARLQRGPTPE